MPANRQKTGKRKAPSTAWRPGESGNPDGRPKLSPDQKAARLEAQAILDAHTVAAAWAAVDMLQHSDAKARAAALNSILDRAGLKGVDRLQLTGADGGPIQHDLKLLNDKEAKALRDLVAKTVRDR